MSVVLVLFIQTWWTQCPVLGATLSILSTHQSKRNPFEEKIISRSTILCSWQALAVRAMLMKIDLFVCRDWAKEAHWSGWFALHPGSIQQCASVHTFTPACLLDSWIGISTAPTFSQAELLLCDPQVSDLLTMSPIRLSLFHADNRMGLWPWHTEPKRADVVLYFLFKCSTSHPDLG